MTKPNMPSPRKRPVFSILLVLVCLCSILSGFFRIGVPYIADTELAESFFLLFFSGLLLLLLYVWPLRFIALGEISLSFLTGPLLYLSALCISFWLYPLPQTELFSTDPILLLWLAGFIIMSERNIRRYEHDKSLQQYSLPVLIGKTSTRRLYLFLVFLALFYLFAV